MRTEVVSGKSQADYQAFITEDLLIVTKDRVGELGMEGGKSLRLGVAWLHDRNMERIIGVA